MRRIDGAQLVARFVEVANIRPLAVALEERPSKHETRGIHVRRNRDGRSGRDDRRKDIGTDRGG